MASMGSLIRAASGLVASQNGLYVTGHNLSNANTTGYVRQQSMQQESNYLTIGYQGKDILSVGLGVDVAQIRQIRDSFLDQNYRNEIGRYGFYNAQSQTIDEIEAVLGEIDGESISQSINDLWDSLNELSKNPSGQETRGIFVQSAVIFINKANHIADQLEDYQFNLNTQIKDRVKEINTLTEQIQGFNEKISYYEASGDHANDLRDERNLALDRLSELIDIQYHEDKTGRINITTEGHTLLSGNYVSKIKLEQTADKSPFVKPVWADTNTDVFNMNKPVGAYYQNDLGELKGLLYARGDKKANYTDFTDSTKYQQIEGQLIPKTQAQFDYLVHTMVTMINDQLSPKTEEGKFDTNNAPYDFKGDQSGLDLFKRVQYDRYKKEADGNLIYIKENEAQPDTLYTAGNLEVNPEILEDYDKLALYQTKGNLSDNTLIEEMITQWESPQLIIHPDTPSTQLSIGEYYANMIGEIGGMGQEAIQHLKNQETMVKQVEGQRNAISSVSLDEEMSNMLKYQHAYNASARVVSVIDSMMDVIVNRLGVVGR